MVSLSCQLVEEFSSLCPKIIEGALEQWDGDIAKARFTLSVIAAALKGMPSMPQQRSSPDVTPPLPSSPTAPTHPLGQPTTGPSNMAYLSWDYENINPRYFGAQVVDFYLQTSEMLLRDFGVRLAESAAYLVAGIDYGLAPTKLAGLQVKMRIAPPKREAADREISADLQTIVARHTTPQTFVLISSDKDFCGDVKRLVGNGHRVIVIHAAIPGSDHDRILKLHATTSIAVSSYYVQPPAPTSEAPTDLIDITIDGKAIPRDSIVATHAAVEYCSRLRATPGTPPLPPKLCGRTDAHDYNSCPMIHIVPLSIRVDGKTVQTTHLRRSSVFEFLAGRPGVEGRWCANTGLHDIRSCLFAHGIEAQTPPEARIREPAEFAPLALMTPNVRSSAWAKPTQTPPESYGAPSPIDSIDVLNPAVKSGAPPPYALTNHLASPARSFASFPQDSGDFTTAVMHTPPPAPIPIFGVTPAPNSAKSEPPIARIPEHPPPPRSITIEGREVLVSKLVMNPGLAYLIQHPNVPMGFCSGQLYDKHDPEICAHIHWVGASNRPSTCGLVAGRPVLLELLEEGPSKEYLKANPGSSAKWCTRSLDEHCALTCKFAHRKGETAPARVRVDDDEVDIDVLVENAGVAYLRANPGKVGRQCKNTKLHNPGYCTYIHFKPGCEN